jgi:hypothetical protein
MSESEPISPRARLQQLQAIPERQRTDAEWDELNELEIMLASGNRQGAPNPNVRNTPPMSSGQQRQGGNQPRPGGGPHRGQRPGRKFHQRPPKPR